MSEHLPSTVRTAMEKIAMFPNRSEKTSWKRKQDNMVKLIARLRPIEDKILELQKEKEPLLDEISELRKAMVESCIHPMEYLVYHDDHIVCKFCNRKLSIPK